jgi:hypothetical protein
MKRLRSGQNDGGMQGLTPRREKCAMFICACPCWKLAGMVTVKF